MTRRDLLEATYDGPIPRALYDEARRLDRLHPLPPADLKPRRKPAPTPARTVSRMATTMILCVSAAGACTEDDLRAAGFSAAEILAFADRARSEARRYTAERTIA